MKGITRTALVATTLLVVLAVSAAAGVSGATPAADPSEALAPDSPSSLLFSYQGQLTDAAGNAISNSAMPITFRLFTVSSGGIACWTENHTGSNAVAVTKGLFNVLLGQLTAIPSACLTGNAYLELVVNSETLSPRELLTSVAFAVEAGTLTAGAQTRGALQVNGSLYQLSPDSNIYGIQLRRTDEENRTHTWDLWHMNQQYGMNAFQIYEYRTDGSGVSCGGNTADGAICAPRLTIWSGGDVCIGCQTTTGGDLEVKGQGFFGDATNTEGAVIIEHAAVPLIFKESGQSGQGSLWRMPLHDKDLRFDISTNGTDFTNYITPLRMWHTGSVTCGALTEAGLQTPKELEAGGTDRFEAGDVLCWGIDQLEKCSTPNDRLVQAVADSGGRPIVIGAEAVKVLGPVKRGDILVASSVAGYAMVNNDPISGSVIAQALADFDDERGVIKAMIRKF